MGRTHPLRIRMPLPFGVPMTDRPMPPADWTPYAFDHAVARYRNRVEELFYFSMKGHISAVGHAYEFHTGDGTPSWLPDLSENLLRAVALTLNSEWQNDAVEWLSETQAFKHHGETDYKAFRANSSPKEIDKHVKKLRGCGVASFPEYPTIIELQLVTNAIRHGPGPSLERLHAAHPELWVETGDAVRLRPWYLPADEPMPRFHVKTEDLTRYKDAVCGFWTRISNAALTRAATGYRDASSSSES